MVLNIQQRTSSTPVDDLDSVSDDKQGNLLAVLRVVEVLVIPVQEGAILHTTARDQNTAILLQHGLLPSLLALSLNADVMPAASVRAQVSTLIQLAG